MKTDYLWARFDLCLDVNRAVNGELKGSRPIAVALEKIERLVAAGVDRAELEIATVVPPGGAERAVVLVKDRIARWVLAHDSLLPSTLEERGYVIRSEGAIEN